MAKQQNNEANIEGNNNLLLQSVRLENSELVINNFGDDSFWNKLEEIIENRDEDFFYILVLATNQERIRGLEDQIEGEINLPLNYYGNNPRDWVPYTNGGSIESILQEYSQKSRFKLEIIYIDGQQVLENEFWDDIMLEVRKKAILIVDCLSLCYADNYDPVRQNYSDPHFGGCLIPICENHQKDVKGLLEDLQQKKLDRLHRWYNERFEKQFMFIELSVPNKIQLFRRITNIAVKCLSMKPKSISWNERRREQQSTFGMRSLKGVIG